MPDSFCDCGHDEVTHMADGKTCIWSQYEGYRHHLPMEPSSCWCRGFVPRANWINELLRTMRIDHGCHSN